MQIIITMAGLGSRFRAVGYTVPKYMIWTKGRTLFSWSMESLRHFFPGNDVTFVVRKEDDPESFIREEMSTFGLRNMRVVSLDWMTDGQATTVLESLSGMGPAENEPIMIYNIDTYVEPWSLKPEAIRGQGWVPCFPGEGSAWSFIRCDVEGRALEAKEKVRISDHATIGLYYFDSVQRFRSVYRDLFGQGMPEGLKEKYVAPMYQKMIEMGLDVRIHQVPLEAVHPLGTPEEVQMFEADPRVPAAH